MREGRRNTKIRGENGLGIFGFCWMLQPRRRALGLLLRRNGDGGGMVWLGRVVGSCSGECGLSPTAGQLPRREYGSSLGKNREERRGKNEMERRVFFEFGTFNTFNCFFKVFIFIFLRT